MIAGLSTLIGVRISAEYPTLVSDVTHFGHQFQSWLAGPPFHVKQTRLEQLVNKRRERASRRTSRWWPAPC